MYNSKLVFGILIALFVWNRWEPGRIFNGLPMWFHFVLLQQPSEIIIVTVPLSGMFCDFSTFFRLIPFSILLGLIKASWSTLTYCSFYKLPFWFCLSSSFFRNMPQIERRMTVKLESMLSTWRVLYRISQLHICGSIEHPFSRSWFPSPPKLLI